MMKILNLIILLLLSNSVLSQKKNKKNIYPHSTSAEQRLKGYNDRLNLNSKSIVKNIRKISKKDMILNDYCPKIEVNPETYEVLADGELITCEPAKKLPLAQRYFMY